MQSTLANLPRTARLKRNAQNQQMKFLLSAFLLKEKQIEERGKEKSPRVRGFFSLLFILPSELDARFDLGDIIVSYSSAVLTEICVGRIYLSTGAFPGSIWSDSSPV